MKFSKDKKKYYLRTRCFHITRDYFIVPCFCRIPSKVTLKGLFYVLIFNVSSIFWVTVFKFFIVPPRIQSTEVHYTVNENSQVVLPCVADGIPTPAIHWGKDSVRIANLLGKSTTRPDGELVLENVVVSLVDVNTHRRAKRLIRLPLLNLARQYFLITERQYSYKLNKRLISLTIHFMSLDLEAYLTKELKALSGLLLKWLF